MADGVQQLLKSARGTENNVLELGWTRDHLATNAVVLHMLSHPFVGVKFWGVGRPVEQPELAVGLRDAVLDHAGVVGRVVVHDQEHGPILVVNEPTQAVVCSTSCAAAGPASRRPPCSLQRGVPDRPAPPRSARVSGRVVPKAILSHRRFWPILSSGQG